MKRVMALMGFQVAVMMGWAAQNESLRASAPAFRIPLRPSDPSQALPGRSFVLNPRDGQIKTGEEGVALAAEEVKRFLGAQTSFFGPALVGFCPQGESHRVCALARLGEPREAGAQYWSRARLAIRWEAGAARAGQPASAPGHRVTVDLLLDRFFLPKGTVLPAAETEPGWEVEVGHRPGLPPLPRRLLFRGRPVLAD